MDLKKVKSSFIVRGGFQTAKGHLVLTDKDNCTMYMYNDKEGKVKRYMLGNGGVNWEETMEVEDFEKEVGATKQVSK